MPNPTAPTATATATATPGVHAVSAHATHLDVRDATTVLAAADLTVLTPDTPNITGVRIRPAHHHTGDARIIVVPVVDGQEQLPPAHPAHNDRRATWTHLMAATRLALTAAGWEGRGETPTGGEFLAHTPAVRMARAVLTAAGIPLLPTGASSGAGALVHPVDGDQYQVRIAAWAAGHRHTPLYPADESPEAEAWRTLMRQVLAAMAAANWHDTTRGAIYDCAQHVVPDDTTLLPERPTPVLGCDPEEDATVHQIARLLRAEGFMPLAAFARLDGPAWGFGVSSTPAAPDHVMVTYDHRGLAPVSARFQGHDVPKVHAMLAAYEATLNRHGMTCANTDADGTVLWVNRPTPRSARARIHVADTTGFAWLPDLTATYQHETRRTDDQPWEPQATVTQKSMLSVLEHGLRRGWLTADVEDRTIYATLTDPYDEFARYSRYVPSDTP
ncbi:hypothetical protein [Streptomyces sp. CA-106110]|uniref:hypothetical protein n=1 Tax=Streptomyces sp. CA-106110 TaxID=3240044 RepID=UPI003D8AF2F0